MDTGRLARWMGSGPSNPDGGAHELLLNATRLATVYRAEIQCPRLTAGGMVESVRAAGRRSVRR